MTRAHQRDAATNGRADSSMPEHAGGAPGTFGAPSRRGDGSGSEMGSGSEGTEKASRGPTRRSVLWLVVVAAAIRVAYLAESLSMPFIEGPLGDSEVYLAQAEHVLQGDFAHATLLALSPLYGYVLAALGSHGLLVVVVQQLLGVATTALIAVEAGRRFGERAGLAAAALYLGYGFVCFLETKLLSDALGLDLLCAGFALYLRNGRRHALLAGVFLALSTLARASLVFSLPLLVVAAVVPRCGGTARWRRTAQRVGALVLGLGVVIGANAGWTFVHGGVAVPIIYASSDVNVVARSSRSEWTGDLRAVALTEAPPGPWDRVHRVEAALETRASDDLGGALDAIDLAGWASQLPGRLVATFDDRERTFQYGYYGERGQTTALDLLPLTFPGLALIGLLGAWFLYRREGLAALAPFVPLVLGAIAATTLAHPSSRYRLGMLLPLVWLGGYAVQSLFEQRGRRPAQIAALVVALTLTAGAVRGWTYRLRYPEAWELTLAESHAKAWQVGEARRHAARARALTRDPTRVEPVLRRLGL